jgi:ABC-type transport system involved in cytochrome c biogenesis permease subunit
MIFMSKPFPAGAVFLCLFFASLQAFATASPCPESLESLPVLSGGRVRPLALHARERIKFITGKSSIDGKSAVETYCLLSLESALGDITNTIEIPIRVNHVETRRFIGIPEDQGDISLTEGLKKLPDIGGYAATLKSRGENTPFAKDLAALALRVSLSQDIVEGRDWTVPVFHSGDGHAPKEPEWMPLNAWVSVTAKDRTDSGQITASLLKLGEVYKAASGDRYLLELTYDRLRLFHWAILAVLVTMAIVSVAKNVRGTIVLASAAVTFVLEIAAVSFRTVISGRAPVANMYETVMWAGLSGLFFAVLLALARREKLFLMAGLVFNLCCLFLMTFATDMLDPAIKPLVPVLRDNFWLSTHVTSVTLSYAAFALSWLLADYEMARAVFGRSGPDSARRIGALCYDALKVGVVFLALGIILGGIWADYSWGRFWGWDPKETWSLIALMTYMAVLHGRLAGWITPTRFIPLTALAFLSIVMTWFGVNYVLATGLHSYGFSEGGTVFLASLAAAQFALVGFYALRGGLGSNASQKPL